jgi:hypothetical protein
LMSITSILTRTPRIRAWRSHRHQRHFCTQTQTQPERAAAIQLARLSFFKLDCVSLEGIGWAVVFIMPSNRARRFKTLKYEAVLAWKWVNRGRIWHISIQIGLDRILEIRIAKMSVIRSVRFPDREFMGWTGILLLIACDNSCPPSSLIRQFKSLLTTFRPLESGFLLALLVGLHLRGQCPRDHFQLVWAGTRSIAHELR